LKNEGLRQKWKKKNTYLLISTHFAFWTLIYIHFNVLIFTYTSICLYKYVYIYINPLYNNNLKYSKYLKRWNRHMITQNHENYRSTIKHTLLYLHWSQFWIIIPLSIFRRPSFPTSFFRWKKWKKSMFVRRYRYVPVDFNGIYPIRSYKHWFFTFKNVWKEGRLWTVISTLRRLSRYQLVLKTYPQYQINFFQRNFE
jgi:hypothetical protein